MKKHPAVSGQRRISFGAVLLLAGAALFVSGRCGALEGPDLDEPAAAPTGVLTPADLAFVDRLLARSVNEGSPLDTQHLRRLRALLVSGGTRASASEQAPQALNEQMLRVLQQRVVESRASREAAEWLAMFQLYLDRPDEALHVLRKIGPAGREDLYWPLRMAYTYLRLGDYANGAQHLKTVRELLADRLPLELGEPVFCTAITAYRLYMPRPDKALQPGEDVLIYLEIDGVSFRELGRGEATADLAFGLEIRDELQQVRWSRPNYGTWQPSFRGPIHDLHVSVALEVPENLPPGRYHLFVDVRDVVSGREGVTSRGFDLGQRFDPAPRAPGAAAVPPALPSTGAASTDDAERLRWATELMNRHRSRWDATLPPEGP